MSVNFAKTLNKKMEPGPSTSEMCYNEGPSTSGTFDAEMPSTSKVSDSGKPSTSKMSDAERLELAAKLDKELDEFIDGLERRRYTEGWPEDRWQEEMDKHPFFMKKAPEIGDEVHPLLEGIQQLKFDPAENTAEDLASNYKEDGNFYIKHKKFRLAILSFTEGLKAKCVNDELNATLYNNRSAAHFFLKNYRSSLLDAEKALALKSDYYKAKWRAAQCAFQLNKFEIGFKHCEEILEKDPNDEKSKDLLKNLKTKKLELERNERKRTAGERRKANELKRTIEEIKKRGVQFDDIHPNWDSSEEFLKPKLLPLVDHPVNADENGVLSWPAAFSYPEFLFSDFMQELNENTVIKDSINEMFAEPLDCDKEYKYKPETVALYYENRKAHTVHKVDLKKTVKEILKEKNFYVSGGALLFYVVTAGSQVEKEFLEKKP